MSSLPKILVVDDNPANLHAMRKVLQLLDAELFMASNGNDALGLALENEFALALLDVRMPGMDGFELATLLHESEEGAKIPIIFVTGAAAEAEDALTGYKSGAFDYIIKPLQPHIMRSKAQVFLDLYEARRRVQGENSALEEVVAERTAELLDALTKAEQSLIEAEQAREAAEKLRQRAEDASLAKNRFLSKVSHELLTPMNGIMGMLQLLDAGELSHSQIECINVVNQSANTLADIVGQMLEYAGAEDPRQRLSAIPFSLQDLQDDIDRFAQPTATAKGLTYTSRITGAPAERLLGDSDRVSQILNNLMSNALKYTEKGSIALNIDVKPEGHLHRVNFHVQDTGSGISEEKLKTIFEGFVQADDTSTRKHGGIGLGLTLALASARSMHGDISVESEKGKGSEFTFSLALPSIGEAVQKNVTKPEPVEVAEATPATPRTVLLAEDNKINQIVATGMLEKLGFAVDISEDGQQALEQVCKKPYVAVFMDLDMPRMDGLEASRHIRALEHPCSDIPIIAVTANLESGARAKCMDAGMNEYVPKPLKLAPLNKVLEHLQLTSGQH